MSWLLFKLGSLRALVGDGYDIITYSLQKRAKKGHSQCCLRALLGSGYYTFWALVRALRWSSLVMLPKLASNYVTVNSCYYKL